MRTMLEEDAREQDSRDLIPMDLFTSNHEAAAAFGANPRERQGQPVLESAERCSFQVMLEGLGLWQHQEPD